MGKSIGKIVGTAFAFPTGGASLKWGRDIDKAANMAQNTQKQAQLMQASILAEQGEILKQQKQDALAKRKDLIDQQREQISTGNYKTNATSTTGISSSIRGTLG